MKHPKVSILIATYNQEAYIKDAVYSALGLNYPNLEVIVSDDSSTDNTFDLLRDIKDDRLRIYRNEKNIGRILNHRKLLYDLARGGVVAFLDGDDLYLDKDFLLEAVELFQGDEDIVSVLGNYEDLFYTGERKKILSIRQKLVVSGLDIFFRKVKVRYAHGAWIFRRKLIEKVEFFSGRVPIGDDLEGWYKSLLHGKVALIPNVIFAHRIHFDNGVVKVDGKRLVDDLIVYDLVADDAIKLGIDKGRIEKWKHYWILKQAESFVSWAKSLHRRGIYSDKQLEDLMTEFSMMMKDKYGIPFLPTKNSSLLSLQFKVSRMFKRI